MPGFSLFPVQGALGAFMGHTVSRHANLMLSNVLCSGHNRGVNQLNDGEYGSCTCEIGTQMLVDCSEQFH